MTNSAIIIETTYQNLEKAKELAEILLKKKLASCIHFVKIESLYVWEERVVGDDEFLLRIKTEKRVFSEVETEIKKHHPYQVPQIFSLKIDEISAAYHEWIKNILR